MSTLASQGVSVTVRAPPSSASTTIGRQASKTTLASDSLSSWHSRTIPPS